MESSNVLLSHSVVVHQENFVDPNDSETHTQNIENKWHHVKNKLKRMKGTPEELFPFYLAEFMWRSYFEPKYFVNLIVTITEQYVCLTQFLFYAFTVFLIAIFLFYAGKNVFYRIVYYSIFIFQFVYIRSQRVAFKAKTKIYNWINRRNAMVTYG